MKFSIRDLLFVIMIAAILVAWWVDHRRLRHEVEKNELENHRLQEAWQGSAWGPLPVPRKP